MANQLFLKAKEHISRVKQSPTDVSMDDIDKTKSAISSAFANTNEAEQELLQQYQQDFDKLDIK